MELLLQELAKRNLPAPSWDDMAIVARESSLNLFDYLDVNDWNELIEAYQ